jgi:hypothetical protein
MVKRGPHGYFGLYATQAFPKDSVLYRGQQRFVPNIYKEYDMILDHEDGTTLTIPSNTHTHCVWFTDTKRWLYTFDAFTNHSCNPTTISRTISSESYDAVALVDIQPGDEITCDYNVYEYDCVDKTIDVCNCNSKDCVGRVAGFRYLAPEQQRQRIQLVDESVLEAMTRDPVNKFIYVPDLKCPTDRVQVCVDSIMMQESRHGVNGDVANMPYRKLVAMKDYAEGDILYSVESLVFPHDWSIVIQIGHERVYVDNLLHTTNKGNGMREFFFFDSFQNHSCDPNTKMQYISETMYNVIASKPIRKDDELTMDYETIDDGLDGMSFTCSCGANVCRGVIQA